MKIVSGPRVRQALLLAVCLAVCGCQGSSGPSSPSSSAGAYAGQWSGTTAQGRPITFTIGPNDKVTAITLDHAFSSCAGSQSFSNLSISIVPQVECIPAPCPASLTSFRQFDYDTGNGFTAPNTEVHGIFMSTSRAEGSVNFRNFQGCGTVLGVSWTASKR
jgi:hypothetical protein